MRKIRKSRENQKINPKGQAREETLNAKSGDNEKDVNTP
jgi:hypothetical protein